MSLAGVICLQKMESNIEITNFFFLFREGISIRGKAWEADRIQQLYREWRGKREKGKEERVGSGR